MGATEKSSESAAEITMTENHKRLDDVVINIFREEGSLNVPPASDTPKYQNHEVSSDLPQKLSVESISAARNSPEIARINPSSSKPPKVPQSNAPMRRKSLSRSVYSKPKSRFGEITASIDSNMFEENESTLDGNILSCKGSPNHNQDTNSVLSRTPKTPLGSSHFVAVDEDEEIYKKVNSWKKLRYSQVKAKVLIEWVLFLCVLGCLVASLTIEKLQGFNVWGLPIWRWCVLILVTFSGMFISRWFIHFVVLLIELNYLLKKKVMYFVYGLKKSVQVFIWLILVLATWILLFKEGVKRSRKTSRILDFITLSIVSLLIGAFLWLSKTLLLKMLASTFHVNTFFDRIQESIFHQYIMLTLSGPPIMESAQILQKTKSNISSFRVTKKGKEGEVKEKQVIDVNKLHQMRQEKVSAWTMKMLVDVISNSGLRTLSTAIDESFYDEGNSQLDKEITNEEEALAAAYHIFRNVAQPRCTYIDEYDLRRFMIKEEVEIVIPMIDAAESGQIDRKSLTDWVLKVYKGRKALAHALNDTKTAVKQLNKLVSAILVVIIVLIWLLLTGIATTKVLVFLSSQLVLAAFMFGNTCKTIFEAIIFVFVMHPFDVGDRCVVDGIQMIVEEMNILTTVFLRFDNEKIYYPNSVLATKPISNFYRSPDMGDSFEFSIDFNTPLEKIGSLKEKIKKYLDKNPQHWHPNHNVVVKEIENVNKIKMALFFNHTMNFQDFAERNRRRTDLVLEMKKTFEELDIRYHLLHQQVHLLDMRATSEETWKGNDSGALMSKQHLVN